MGLAQTGVVGQDSGVLLMKPALDATPDLIPVLSRGKHRNPRKGACLMEFASYLAGERWSDHPDCTHPLLATLARLVNDYTTDVGRNRLAGLAPSVIGVTGDDLRLEARIVLRCATTALPIASYERQRVMAVAVLTAERILADLNGGCPHSLTTRSSWALSQAPDAALWAERFTRRSRTSQRRFRRHAAPSAVHFAVDGIARACVPDPDAVLYQLLANTIDDCRSLLGSQAQESPTAVVSVARVNAASEPPHLTCA